MSQILRTKQRIIGLAVLVLLVGCQAEPGLPALPSGPIPVAATNLLTRAQLSMGEGDLDGALRAVDESLRRAPHFARAQVVRGYILGQMDSLVAARDAFEAALAIDPDSPFVYFYLGNNALQRRRLDEAIGHYDAEIRRLTAETPLENRRAVWMQLGFTHRELGALEQAREAFAAVLAADSTFDLAYAALAKVYQDDGLFEEALSARRKALALNADNAEYLYETGALLVQMGRADEALPLLEQASEALPWFHGARYNLGRSLLALGRTAEGEQALAVADSLQQRQAQLGLARAGAEARDTPAAWAGYADQLTAAGRPQEALSAYRMALTRDPANERVRAAIAALEPPSLP